VCGGGNSTVEQAAEAVMCTTFHSTSGFFAFEGLGVGEGKTGVGVGAGGRCKGFYVRHNDCVGRVQGGLCVERLCLKGNSPSEDAVERAAEAVMCTTCHSECADTLIALCGRGVAAGVAVT
jgi:hypothetical protein